MLGAVLDDRFVLEERIATGGFAAIYRARTASGELVAIKVLHRALAGDPSMVARFRREGAILTRLRDPHTVTTLAVGETTDGTCYIAMELLSGESLHDRLLRAGALRWQAAAAIARAVCRSLGEAHALGVVHRDLKPANIHVEPRRGGDVVKVLDFGIVKIAPGSSIDDGHELTCAGHRIGTYDYASPEQLMSGACDARSDLYSLGVVLYEMVTGQRPFADTTGPTAMMAAMLTQAPPAPSTLAVIPAELEQIVLRCLQREPEGRFASVDELAAELDRVLALHDTVPEHDTVLRPSLTIIDDEGTWIDAPPLAGPEPTPAPPMAAGTGATSLSTTLQGVAVAPKAHPRHARVFAVPAVAAQAERPPMWVWVPEPDGRGDELARGSSVALPARAARVRWRALACVAAVVLAAVVLAAVALAAARWLP